METSITTTSNNFIGKPDNFPFNNRAELAAVKNMKGRHFLYHSKYSKTPMELVCGRVFVRREGKVERVVSDNSIGTLLIERDCVYVESIIGNQYDWSECEFIEEETSAEVL